MTFLLQLAFLASGLLGPEAATVAAHPTLSARFDFEHREARFDLPGRLREASGLAFTVDGTLLSHGDEAGVVYRIHPGDGAVDRGFRLGERTIADDFEGVATVGERIFLVSSRGTLYETRMGRERGWSPVRITDTGLGGGCEIEGLAYDRGSDAFWLACKTLQPQVAEVHIHRIPLEGDRPAPPPLRIPWSDFNAWDHSGAVNPSAVDVDPVTGTLVLAAARQALLFEVDLDGRLLDVVHLKEKRHPQVEGLAFGPDGALWLADEGDGDDGRITEYRRRPGDAAGGSR